MMRTYGEKINANKISVRTSADPEHLGDIHMEGRIILKRIFIKLDSVCNRP